MSVSPIASASESQTLSATRPTRELAAAVTLWLLVTSAGIPACTTLPDIDAPQEYLDQTSAATVDVVGRPLIFARERPERATHMRDYITLAAASVDRAGKTDYVLIAYYWSTLDAHGRAGETPYTPERLVVAADDRRIILTLQGHSSKDAGIATPVHAPESQVTEANVYRTDLGTLRFMAAARHLALYRSADDPDSRYSLWQDRRDAIGALVNQLSGKR